MVRLAGACASALSAILPQGPARWSRGICYLVGQTVRTGALTAGPAMIASIRVRKVNGYIGIRVNVIQIDF